jgi:hypothetical protein
MPGIQDFTYFNIGKETTRGTPVAPTRQLYLEGTGNFEPSFNINFHEGENYGRRSRIRRATSQGEDVVIHGRSVNGFPFDSYVFPLSQLLGALVYTGAGADRTVTVVPSMTAANNPLAFSVDVGDDVQNWRLQYAMLTRWKQSAGLNDLTQLEFDGFAQRAVKTAKASPAANTAVVIPGDLWTWKFATTFAGLTGASVQANLVVDHELEVLTGIVAEHYQDGNPYFGQHVETSIGGTLKLTVESTAFAITEFYDKAVAQTLDFVRAKATSPVVLGASFYSLQHDMGIFWDEPKIISRERDGINLYEVSGHLTDDGANGPINSVLVTSLTATP